MNNAENQELPLAKTATAGYEYDQLEKRFHNRLITQDRISHSKTVFYPIRFIKALFEQHDKLAGMGLISSSGGRLKWLNRWLDNCIARITVITEKGNFTLADIDWLEIDPQAKRTTVLLPDGQKALLMTETHRGDIVPMSASTLDDITIDHTPNIAHVLYDNAKHLPALAKLTELMRQQAREENIKLDYDHISQLNKAVFRNVGLDELAPFIPKLARDLMLVASKSELKLMESQYNLRKK